METPRNNFNEKPGNTEGRRTWTTNITSRFIEGLKITANQIAASDLNLGEGKLRGSVMPDKYIAVPDYPPMHDDAI